MKNLKLTRTGISLARMALTGVCLALSLVGYFYATDLERTRAEEAFRYITNDSLGAFGAKVQSITRALDSGAAFFAASDNVTLAEWIEFTSKLDFENTLPGVNGLGFITPVERDKTDLFLAETAADGVTDFRIKQDDGAGDLFVIKYIEPAAINREAIGLNIAFEAGRRATAIKARDTGQAQITPRIFLVQDETRQPGFLMLEAIYQQGAPLNTVEQRRAAFLGWVYAPFVGARTLDQLTQNQEVNFDVAFYEGETTSADTLIYSSASEFAQSPQFTTTEQVTVLGQRWTISWNSTPLFDAAQKSLAPYVILFAGFALSGLIYLLFSMMARRETAISDQVAYKTRELSSLQGETRAVWENALVPILVLDDAGILVTYNPAAADLLGDYGSDRYRKIVDSLALRVQNKAKKTCRGIIAVPLEDDILVLDVQRNHWTAPNGDGRTTMIVQNVTEERDAARRIEETEQRWHLALKGGKIGVFDIDLRNNVQIVSNTWHDIMETPEEGVEDAYAHFFSRVHPDDLPLIQANDDACINGDSERSVTEYRVRFGKDTWRWMRSDAVVVARDENGVATRMVGAQTDITDIRSAREALEASRSRFRQLLENAPVGMAILDEHGVFIGLNGAMTDLVGYSREDLLHNRVFSDLLSHEDIVTVMKQIGKKSENRSQAYQGEHLLRHKDGREIWGLLSISWGFDPVEQGDVFIAQIQDITEKKNVESLKDSFVSTVSHELRTPLTSIKGALGLVQAKFDNAEVATQKRLIEMAYKNTDRLVELVNDILAFEGLVSGQLKFSFSQLELQTAIADAAKLIKPFADLNNTEITLDLPETPIPVNVDAAKLSQVLTNLLSNACKFSADKGVVQVRAEIQLDRALVYVIDNGTGVPHPFRTKIFEPFSQADGSDTRSKGGTGLGLSISRKIIERMGGEIDFESPREGLTVFWFSLPVAKTTASHGAGSLKKTSEIRILHG